MNKIRLQQLDKTCKNRSKPINSIAATSRIMEYAEGCEVINYNNIAEIDYRAYMMDINVEEYFKEEFSAQDNINHVMLNPVKRSHRNTFEETIEEQLQLFQLENYLRDMMSSAMQQ